MDKHKNSVIETLICQETWYHTREQIRVSAVTNQKSLSFLFPGSRPNGLSKALDNNQCAYLSIQEACLHSLNEPRAAKFLRFSHSQKRSRLPIPCLTPEGERKVDRQEVERDEGDEGDRSLSRCLRNHRWTSKDISSRQWTHWQITTTKLALVATSGYYWLFMHKRNFSNRKVHTGSVTVSWIVCSITCPGDQAPFCSCAHACLWCSVVEMIMIIGW